MAMANICSVIARSCSHLGALSVQGVRDFGTRCMVGCYHNHRFYHWIGGNHILSVPQGADDQSEQKRVVHLWTDHAAGALGEHFIRRPRDGVEHAGCSDHIHIEGRGDRQESSSAKSCQRLHTASSEAQQRRLHRIGKRPSARSEDPCPEFALAHRIGHGERESRMNVMRSHLQDIPGIRAWMDGATRIRFPFRGLALDLPCWYRLPAWSGWPPFFFSRPRWKSYTSVRQSTDRLTQHC